MNPFTISGILAGIVLGFLLGRSWAEYFNAAAVGQQAHNNRKNYRGRSTLAWYLGAFLVIGGVLFFGYAVPA
ncbi:hypothetical protein Acsp06_62090 [Actinomycetospora sp. NBRC 106375]|uniref:hypothetical protein n=1 Tax=Actinomycetospora sp. NBRC 106375 TaxID=3032207 RepID=UPI0024A03E68|nr:hypothetical protein [Actinomycetospora sp. NBRC 106375]GLZ50024.1 hypothetical protein Acsp06_62090 [Actinomycetospora sp. NBRC 106375]